jgi:hypothetical protein
MKIDGRCHCGAISYEADIDPDKVIICHCTDCQVISGSPYRVTVFANAADVTMHGTPKEYIKTAESGNKRVQVFCEHCGAHLYATGYGEAAKIYGLRWGTIAQRDQLTPSRQAWCRSAEPWTQDLTVLPSTDTA